MSFRSRVASALGALILAMIATFGASTATAAGYIDVAAGKLQNGAVVYVDSNVVDPTLNNAKVSDLKARIAKGKHPMFVAVLPIGALAQANNNPDQLVGSLATKVHLGGVYAVWVANGNNSVFRTVTSTNAGVPQAGSLATKAYQDHAKEGSYATLGNFIDSIEALPITVGSVTKEPASSPWMIILIICGVALVVIVVSTIIISKRRKSKFKADKDVLLAKATALQEEINSFRPSVSAANMKLGSALSMIQDALATIGNAKNQDNLRSGREMFESAQTLLAGAKNLENPPVPQRRTQPRHSAPPVAQPPVTYATNNWTGDYSRSFGPSYHPPTYGNYPGRGVGYYNEAGDFIAGAIVGVAAVLITEAIVNEIAEEQPHHTHHIPVNNDGDGDFFGGSDDDDDRGFNTFTIDDGSYGGGGGGRFDSDSSNDDWS